MAVPNVSEGRDAADDAGHRRRVRGRRLVRLLDVHSDADHHRSVFTLAGPPRALCDALLAGAGEAVARIDVMSGPARARAGARASARRASPRRRAGRRARRLSRQPARGAACAEALVLADRIGEELGVPVFLYGELAGRRTRAQLRSRRGRRACAADRSGRAAPGLRSPRLHPSAGATLVARAPTAGRLQPRCSPRPRRSLTRAGSPP